MISNPCTESSAFQKWSTPFDLKKSTRDVYRKLPGAWADWWKRWPAGCGRPAPARFPRWPACSSWHLQQSVSCSTRWKPCWQTILSNPYHRLLTCSFLASYWLWTEHCSKSKMCVGQLNCSVSSKTQKRLKECFWIGWNWTKCVNFRGSPLFQDTYNRKTSN